MDGTGKIPVTVGSHYLRTEEWHNSFGGVSRQATRRDVSDKMLTDLDAAHDVFPFISTKRLAMRFGPRSTRSRDARASDVPRGNDTFLLEPGGRLMD
jgi:hypothetical protein